MSRLVAIELLKLRTTRGPWIFLAAEVILVVIGVAGPTARGLVEGDPMLVRGLFAHAGLAALLTLVLGIGAFGTEYRYRTITDTYLSTPDRNRVLAAKVIAYGFVGLLFGIACAGTALLASGVAGAMAGISIDLTGNEAITTMLGAIGWNVLFAIVGVGLGALLPNLATAIAVALVWIALVEGLVAQLLGDAAGWLPMASGMALGNAPRDGLLEQWVGGLVVAGYALLFVVVGAIASDRRDVA
jgi:ABC-2 type transport system permease protein